MASLLVLERICALTDQSGSEIQKKDQRIGTPRLTASACSDQSWQSCRQAKAKKRFPTRCSSDRIVRQLKGREKNRVSEIKCQRWSRQQFAVRVMVA